MLIVVGAGRWVHGGSLPILFLCLKIFYNVFKKRKEALGSKQGCLELGKKIESLTDLR